MLSPVGPGTRAPGDAAVRGPGVQTGRGRLSSRARRSRLYLLTYRHGSRPGAERTTPPKREALNRAATRIGSRASFARVPSRAAHLTDKHDSPPIIKLIIRTPKRRSTRTFFTAWCDLRTPALRVPRPGTREEGALPLSLREGREARQVLRGSQAHRWRDRRRHRGAAGPGIGAVGTGAGMPRAHAHGQVWKHTHTRVGLVLYEF